MAANATTAIASVQPYLAFVGRTEEALAFYAVSYTHLTLPTILRV